MGFVFLILYIFLTYFRVTDFIPDLAAYRPAFVLAVAGLSFSVFALFATTRPSFRAPQIYLMLGLTFCIPLSRVVTGWIGGGLDAIIDFVPCVGLFFLIIFNVMSLTRLRILAVLLVVCSLVTVMQGVAA